MGISFFMQQSVEHTINQFLDYLNFQKRYSLHTIISYKNDLHSFFDYLNQEFGAMELADIKTVFVRSWLAVLKDSGMESKSYQP